MEVAEHEGRSGLSGERARQSSSCRQGKSEGQRLGQVGFNACTDHQ